VRGDPHGAQRALPREDRVRVEHPRQSPVRLTDRRWGSGSDGGGAGEGDATTGGYGMGLRICFVGGKVLRRSREWQFPNSKG
jgi:hypothetical protein